MRDAITPNLDGIKWTLKKGEEFFDLIQFSWHTYKKITSSVYLQHYKRTIDFYLNRFDISFLNLKFSTQNLKKISLIDNRLDVY